MVARFKFPHEFIETDELSDPNYRANNPDRCYFCKDAMFAKLEEHGGPARLCGHCLRHQCGR